MQNTNFRTKTKLYYRLQLVPKTSKKLVFTVFYIKLFLKSKSLEHMPKQIRAKKDQSDRLQLQTHTKTVRMLLSEHDP